MHWVRRVSTLYIDTCLQMRLTPLGRHAKYALQLSGWTASRACFWKSKVQAKAAAPVCRLFSKSSAGSTMAQQGIQGGDPRPVPKLEDLNTEISKKWAESGRKRAEAENYQDKSFLEKLQVQQNKVKDYAAEKMEQATEAIKSTVSGTGNPDR